MNVIIPGNTFNLVSYTKMDESGPSNQNAYNYIVQDDKNERNKANDVAEQNHRRRHRNQEFLSVALFSYATLTLEPTQNIHNSILIERLRVEKYLNGNPVRMFDRIRMIPDVFTMLCTYLKK